MDHARERSSSDTWRAAAASTFVRSTRLGENVPKPHKCAVCCTFFSLIAIVFLTWVGVYISKDTEYVELTIPADEAATQVFVAAGLYGVTLAISVGFWVKAIWQARNMGPGHHRLDNQF